VRCPGPVEIPPVVHPGVRCPGPVESHPVVHPGVRCPGPVEIPPVVSQNDEHDGKKLSNFMWQSPYS
jgi:hypothetical protein